MAKSSLEKFPKITPLRAYELLRQLDEERGRLGNSTTTGHDRTREALANHVKNALRRAGSR